jgi:3-oxoacyl-[acyl-carrier protein] reductase
MDLGLEGSGALILGATGDIGRATAAALAAEGARIVGTGRDRGRLAELERSLGAASAGTIELDVTDERAVAPAVERAEELLGGIDVLVCAAMAPTWGSVWTVEREPWRYAFEVKYIGTADLCRRVAERMAARRSGVILTLIGVAAEVLFGSNPIGGDVNLTLQRFTLFLASAVAGRGVRVVGVSPGLVRSRRLETFAGHEGGELERTVPIGSSCLPEEVAGLVTFLASPRARYVTGTIVTIDGGLSLRLPPNWTPHEQGGTDG